MIAHSSRSGDFGRYKRVLVIGVGNTERRDDAVGILIARELHSHTSNALEVCESPGDMMALLDCWRGFNEVIIVDAMCGDAEPGQVSWFDLRCDALPEEAFSPHSTHAFSLAQTLSMARSIGELPRSIYVLGVQGMDFGAGRGLSRPVEEAMVRAVAFILARVAARRQMHA